MADKKKLLEIRKKIKDAKPTFVVKESNFSARVKRRWRFPRGKHSKVRQMHKGRPSLVSPGYGSPRAVRGLHASGKEIVVVNNQKELLSLNKETQGAVIASNVGNKKKLSLLELASKEKISLLNVKNIDELKKEIMDKFSLRKKQKAEETKKRSSKKAEIKKKAEEKEKEEETKEKTTDQKEQKKQEKEALDKVITKRQ